MLRPYCDLPPKRRRIILPENSPFRPPNRAKNKEKVSTAHSRVSESEDSEEWLFSSDEDTQIDQLQDIVSQAQKDINSKAVSFKPSTNTTYQPTVPSPRSFPTLLRSIDDNDVENSSRYSVISHNPSAPTESITRFHNSKAEAKEDAPTYSQGKICIPVEEWCLGKIHFLGPCMISFEPKGNRVTVCYEKVEERFYFTQITDVTWSEPETFFCVNLGFNKPMRKQTIGSKYQDYFTPGHADGKSNITFKFNISDDSWSRDGWTAFIQKLQDIRMFSRPLRGDGPAKVVWREACRRASRLLPLLRRVMEHQTSPTARDQRTRVPDTVEAEPPSQDMEIRQFREALEQARREQEETNASLRKLQDDNAKAAKEMKMAQTEAFKHSQEVQRLQETVKLGQEEIGRLKAEKESLSSSLSEATNRAQHLLRVQITGEFSRSHTRSLRIAQTYFHCVEMAHLNQLVKQFASVRARFSDGKVSREEVESTCNELGMDLIVVMSRLEHYDCRNGGENEVQHSPKKRKLDVTMT